MNKNIIILFTALLIGCSKSSSQEENPRGVAEPIGIGDMQDVNAPDYWDNAVLVWEDEFDGDTLSKENWVSETGSNGWGNNELQNYTEDENVLVSEGTLKIIAKKTELTPGTIGYTSARLNSTTNFKYGRMEIRAKIPDHKGNGLWPALWMLGSNIQTAGWPACGEIDIMEYVSFDPNQIHFSIHSVANNHKDGTQVTSGPVLLETLEEEFHHYGILWTDKYLKFYIDDIDNIKLIFPRPAVTNSENWPFSG